MVTNSMTDKDNVINIEDIVKLRKADPSRKGMNRKKKAPSSVEVGKTALIKRKAAHKQEYVDRRVNRKDNDLLDSEQTIIPASLGDLFDYQVPLPSLREIKRTRLRDDSVERSYRLQLNYKKNPLNFIRNELGISTERWKNDKMPDDWSGPPPLWSKQRKILRALPKYRKVAVKSCHGPGKTFTAGLATLYLAYVWHALGITTAPTFRQVRRALWGEIHYHYNNAKRPLGGQLNQTSLELGDKWFVEGFATDNPEANIQGLHEENIFVVIDEAGACDPRLFDMIETILTSENSFVLAIGNPVDNSHPFADLFVPGSGFYPISISAYDIPNVVHGVNYYSKLTTFDWPDKMREKWGEDDPMFISRVLGEFPPEGPDVLIPYHQIERAFYRELEEDKVVSIGVDVARKGNDRTVFGVRWRSGKFRILTTTSKERETETAGRAKEYWRMFQPLAVDPQEGPAINVDDIGVGGGVCDILIEDGFPVNEINVGELPEFPELDDDEEDLERYLNKRAQYYWKLKRLFELGLVDIDDEELMRELRVIEKDYTRKEKFKIEDKDQIRKKLRGRSPDLSDCMMLAFALDEAEIGRALIRWV